MGIPLGPNAVIGHVGDSISAQNVNANVVPWWPPAVASLRAAFSASTPAALPAHVGGVPGYPGVATFDRGAPTWVHSGVSGAHVVTNVPAPSLSNQIPLLPTNITHLILEGGTNDCIDSRGAAQTAADFVTCFGLATARFPLLQAIFVVGVACVGELFTVTGGVASFSGNAGSLGANDASIDAQNASVQAATVSAGWTYLDVRAAAAAFVAARKSAPGTTSGTITFDGIHPIPGGLDVVISGVFVGALAIQVPS